MNLDFETFRNKIEIDIKNYRELDNFSFEKRINLIDNSTNILLYIQRSRATVEQVKDLKQLNVQLMTLAKGNKISNLFLKYIDKVHWRESIKKPISRIQMHAKKIDKLMAAKVTTSQLQQILNNKMLEAVIFDQHVYERMMHFNHPFIFDHNKKLMFKYTERVSLDKEIKEFEKNKDKEWDGEALYHSFLSKKVTLEIKGEGEGERYSRLPISQLTLENFKKIIEEEKNNPNKKIEVIYPPTYINYKDLVDNSVIIRNPKSINDYIINPDYQYLACGFVKMPSSNWHHLKPFDFTFTPPKEFLIDIIVHSEDELPGIFPKHGHASIKITTPKGEIYSVGMYPDNTHVINLSLQKSQLTAPDRSLFLPAKSSKQHVMSYTLSDPKAFHQLINWIEAMQGHDESDGIKEPTSNLFYHPTHQNCAAFAAAFRDYALELGAKSQTLTQHKISNWTKSFFRFKEFLLNFVATTFLGKKITAWDQGLDYAGIKNYNITHLDTKGPYLPIDLILEHDDAIKKISKT